jgi:uncharacterized sodium:solute symporter family permease YidK
LRLSLSSLDLFLCCIVVVASVAIGLTISIRKRSGESSSQFFLAGRGLKWPVVGASLFATNIGAEHLVGLSGDAYRYGLCAGSVELTTCICLGIACAWLFPYYLRTRVFTIPEFLELRFNRTARVFFSGLMLVICIMTKLAFHLYAGALVLHGLFGWNLMSTVVLVGTAIAIITMVGGFTAVAYTDSIQTGIMIAGCSLVLFTGLHQVGGWHALLSRMPEAMHVGKAYDDPNYPFWGIILGAFYGGTFYWGMDQVNVQRVLGAKSLQEARKGSMFAVLLKISPIFIFALPGVIAAALYPGRGETADPDGAYCHCDGYSTGSRRRLPHLYHSGWALPVSPGNQHLSDHAHYARNLFRNHEQAGHVSWRGCVGAGGQRVGYAFCDRSTCRIARIAVVSLAALEANFELYLPWVVGNAGLGRGSVSCLVVHQKSCRCKYSGAHR